MPHDLRSAFTRPATRGPVVPAAYRPQHISQPLQPKRLSVPAAPVFARRQPPVPRAQAGPRPPQIRTARPLQLKAGTIQRMEDLTGGFNDDELMQYAMHLSNQMDPESARLAVLLNRPEMVEEQVKRTGRVALSNRARVRVLQGEEGWCYAATSLALARYRGSNHDTTTVWEVVRDVKGVSLSETQIRQTYGKEFGQEEKALRTLGIVFTNRAGLHLDLIEGCLRANKPVILAWGTHSRVVTEINFDRGCVVAWDPKDNEFQDLDIGMLQEYDNQIEIYYY